jgi:hypothetical protein
MKAAAAAAATTLIVVMVAGRVETASTCNDARHGLSVPSLVATVVRALSGHRLTFHRPLSPAVLTLIDRVREHIANLEGDSVEADILSSLVQTLRIGVHLRNANQLTLAPPLRVDDARTGILLHRSGRLSRGLTTAIDDGGRRGLRGRTILTGSDDTGRSLHLRGGPHERIDRLRGRRNRIRELGIQRWPRDVAAGLAGFLPLLRLFPLLLFLWRGLGDGALRRRKGSHALINRQRRRRERRRTDIVDVRLHDDGFGNAGGGSNAGRALRGRGRARNGQGKTGGALTHHGSLGLLRFLASVLVLLADAVSNPFLGDDRGRRVRGACSECG